MATIGVWGPRGGEKEREEAGIIMQLTKEQRKVRERERESESESILSSQMTARPLFTPHLTSIEAVNLHVAAKMFLDMNKKLLGRMRHACAR